MMSRAMLLVLSLGSLSIASLQSGNLPPQQLPVYGGSGGDAFSRDCGAGKVLTGLRFRTGLLVDAVGILCRPVLAKGELGPETTVGTLAGGGNGGSGSVSCESGTVVMSATINYGSFIDGIVIFCRSWRAIDRTFASASAINDHRAGNTTGTARNETCESPRQPASGIRGRAHSLIDAIGLICDEP